MYSTCPMACVFSSLALVNFACKPDEQYIVVGVSRDLVLAPRSLSGGLLMTYRLTESGSQLEHVHTTPVEDVPGAIAAFQGRVLIGVGKFLRIYDLGKKKLLRKCENKVTVERFLSVLSSRWLCLLYTHH